MPDTQPLLEAGLDSLSAVELRNELTATLNLELPATVIFDYPTVAALSVYIGDRLQERNQGNFPTQRTVQHADAGVVSLEIQQAVANVLGRSVLLDQPLMEAGLDSLAAVELRNELSTRLGVDLSATVVFDYPTISALSRHIAASAATAAVATQQLHSSSFVLASHNTQAEGVCTDLVGLSCRYPSAVHEAASSVDDFWVGTAQAADLQEMVPLPRWGLEQVYAPGTASGKMYARFATFVFGVERFDTEVS